MLRKKEVRTIVLRTLAVFMAVWLAFALIMTARNRSQMEEIVADNFAAPHETVFRNVQKIIEDGTAHERKGGISWMLNSGTGFNDAVVAVGRVYDPEGNELGRSTITHGYITLEGVHSADFYLMFDAVLSEEEQIVFAETLREEWEFVPYFYGVASGKISIREQWPNQGLYGEVTGILDGENIYPQKLMFCYENRTVTLVDSNHTMFDGAEMTTLCFDFAVIESHLNSRYRSPERMLELYRDVDNLICESGVRFVSNSSTTTWARNGRYVCGVESTTGIPYVWAYTYDPVSLATYGMGMTYFNTFLIALIAAILVARGQIKTVKKEHQFTRAVAHEIKTPAAVLRATAEALSEGASPERQREYLSSIMEESDRLAIVVNELLDLSRMEGSVVVLKRQSVDLTALTECAFERFRKPMEQRALDLKLDLQSVTVSGDPKRLEQVVNNLAVNVLEHAQEGQVSVTLKEQGGCAVLMVGNVCPSLTAEQLRHLWDPFYKLDDARSGSGSGLGLAVVKNVITLHGGTCSVRTVADRIEFCIELPLGAG